MLITPPKANRKDWEIDQIEKMKSIILKIQKNKRESKRDLCDSIYRDLINLSNML